MSKNDVLQNILQQVTESAQNTQNLLNRVNSISYPVPINEILVQLENIDTKIQEVTLILTNKPVYFKQTTAVQALASKQLTLNNAQIAKDTITSELISKRQLVVAAQSALTIATTASESASQIVTIKTTAVSEAEAQTTIAINAMQVAAEATQQAQTAEVRAQAAAAAAKIEQDRLARIAAQEAAALAAALIEITQTNITPGNTFIDLSWNTPPNGGINITSYLIKQSVDLSNWVDLSSTTTSFRANNLLNDTIYYFNIRARNNAGLGPESNIIFGIPTTPLTTTPPTPPITPPTTPITLPITLPEPFPVTKPAIIPLTTPPETPPETSPVTLAVEKATPPTNNILYIGIGAGVIFLFIIIALFLSMSGNNRSRRY